MFTNENIRSSDREGVSPVIGVILMVSITVVLGAVIGTFVLNLADNVNQQNAQLEATFDEKTGEQVEIQLKEAPSADKAYVNISEISDKTTEKYDSTGDGVDDSLTVQGGVANDSGNGEHYLLNGDAGGAGTTVTVYTEDSGLTGGIISVIGVLDGGETVVQSYDYSG